MDRCFRGSQAKRNAFNSTLNTHRNRKQQRLFLSFLGSSDEENRANLLLALGDIGS
jgi:hypothetical protein